MGVSPSSIPPNDSANVVTTVTLHTRQECAIDIAASFSTFTSLPDSDPERLSKPEYSSTLHVRKSQRDIQWGYLVHEALGVTMPRPAFRQFSQGTR